MKKPLKSSRVGAEGPPQAHQVPRANGADPWGSSGGGGEAASRQPSPWPWLRPLPTGAPSRLHCKPRPSAWPQPEFNLSSLWAQALVLK